jgi:hypothetical protein
LRAGLPRRRPRPIGGLSEMHKVRLTIGELLLWLIWPAMQHKLAEYSAAHPWIDPVKEHQSAVLGLDAGFGTLEHECAEIPGADWEWWAEVRQQEIEAFKKIIGRSRQRPGLLCRTLLGPRRLRWWKNANSSRRHPG